jgi:hypothetical protein
MGYKLYYPRYKLSTIGVLVGTFYVNIHSTVENATEVELIVGDDDISTLNSPQWDGALDIRWNSEVLDWLQAQQIPTPVYVVDRVQNEYLCLEFSCESHAMMFKLRWLS